MSAADTPLTEPTDERWEASPQDKVLRPWYDPDTGFSQAPFLAAPEGFDSQVKVPEEKRFHAFVSGIGAGKTVGGILRTVANMERWNPGEQGMIVSPTVPHLKNAIMPEMRRWGLLDYWDYQGKGGEEPGLVSPNGSRAILESADNDRKIERLRGPSIAWFWIDEAANLPEKVWKILLGRLRTGEYRNAYITTTPRGFNWVYDRFYGGGDGPPADVNLIYGVPSTANPTLPDDYSEITGEYEGHFRRQEVLGRFVQPEGLVYPWFSRDTHVTGDIPQNPDRMYYGMDFGHKNPSAIVAVMETRTGEHVVVETFYESRVTTSDLISVLDEMQGRWGPGRVWADPSEAAAIDEMGRAGIDVAGAINDIVPGISTVTTLGTRQELLIHESCEPLINELRQYHYDDDSDDEKPVKKNDHAADALRYGVHTHHVEGDFSLGVASGDLYR